MRRLSLPIAMAAILLGAGCSSQPNTVELGTMSISMTDAPAAFDAVNLVINEVSARIDADGSEGWEVLSAEPGTFDLLQLRNGVFAGLAVGSLPAGTYTEIRLMIGEGSNVVVDGVAHPLILPSGKQSGLKLKGEFEVPPGGTQEIELDFDAERSISQNGAGDWMLNPVVRALPATASGALGGQISPQNTVADVIVMQGGATIGSGQTGSDGRFQVSVLPPGIYDVVIRPVAFYREMTLPGVVVQSGTTTDLGMIQLLPPEW